MKLSSGPKLVTWLWCCFVLGGGFRDSIADMAEELCPSSVEAPIPVPFFIRSPNQVFLRSSALKVKNNDLKFFCQNIVM